MDADDTTFREPWEREPTDPWIPTCVIIRRIMASHPIQATEDQVALLKHQDGHAT